MKDLEAAIEKHLEALADITLSRDRFDDFVERIKSLVSLRDQA